MAWWTFGKKKEEEEPEEGVIEMEGPKPYGYLPPPPEEEVEEPEVVEAEYRMMEEPTIITPPEERVPVEPGDREKLRRKREAARFAEELERKRGEAALAKQKSELLKLEAEKTRLSRARYELGRERRKETVAMLKKAAALGGVPSVERPGGIRTMYFGMPKKGLYAPPTPKPPFTGEMPAKEALRPRLEGLRRATMLGPAERVPTDVGYAWRLVTPPGRRGALDYTFLKELAMPRGLSRLEQYAFAEIGANDDRDTLQHIVAELAKLGVSRKQAEEAVKKLLEKGMVKKTRDFKGEAPVYEVVGK